MFARPMVVAELVSGGGVVPFVVKGPGDVTVVGRVAVGLVVGVVAASVLLVLLVLVVGEVAGVAAVGVEEEEFESEVGAAADALEAELAVDAAEMELGGDEG